MDFGINSWEHAVGYFRPACFMDFGESCTLNCTAMGQAALGMVWRKARPPYARQCHKPGPVGNALPRARPPLAMPSQGHGRRWQAIQEPGDIGLAAGRPPPWQCNAQRPVSLGFVKAVQWARALWQRRATGPGGTVPWCLMPEAKLCHGHNAPSTALSRARAPLAMPCRGCGRPKRGPRVPLGRPLHEPGRRSRRRSPWQGLAGQALPTTRPPVSTLPSRISAEARKDTGANFEN